MELNKKGTTLIELIVSIAIIGIISGLVISNFRVGERTNNLNMAAQKLASDIRMMQNYAMSLTPHDGDSPPGGWGVFFNRLGIRAGQYIYFADTDEDHHCQNFNNCPGSNDDYSSTQYFSEGVYIRSIKADGSNANRLYVSFEPPVPIVHICDGAGSCNVNFVEIELTNDFNTRTVTVNKFGLVEVIK